MSIDNVDHPTHKMNNTTNGWRCLVMLVENGVNVWTLSVDELKTLVRLVTVGPSVMVALGCVVGGWVLTGLPIGQPVGPVVGMLV